MSNAFRCSLQPTVCPRLICVQYSAATVLAASRLLLVFLPFGLSATDAAYAQHTRSSGLQHMRCVVEFVRSFVHLFVSLIIRSFIQYTRVFPLVMWLTGCLDVTVLLQVAMPGCLQQFINHNGVLHKVYVMGDQVHTAYRCLLAPFELDVCWLAESTSQCAHHLEVARAAEPTTHAQQTSIHGRKHRLTSLQQMLTAFKNGSMIPKTWNDSVWVIAVRGQHQNYQMEIVQSVCPGPVSKVFVCRCMWLRGNPFPTCLL